MKKLFLGLVAASLLAPSVVCAVPTPTPSYGVPAREMADVEGMSIAKIRSTRTDGHYWQIVRAAFTDTSDYGVVYDSANSMQTGETLTYQPIALKIVGNGGWVDVQQGDYLTVTFDAGSEILIYPPAISGDPVSGTWYVDTGGLTYTDRWLTQIASGVAVPTPTPEPTLTPKKSPSTTPTPAPTVTPQMQENPMAQIAKMQIVGTDHSGNLTRVATDGTTNSLQIIDFHGGQVHAGDAFYISGWTVLSDGDVLYVKLVTPDTGTWAHFGWEIESSGILETDFYENAFNGMTGGAEMTPLNRNRNSTNASTMVITSNVSAFATYSSVLDTKKVGGTGFKSVYGGNASRDAEIVLKQNTTYCRKFESGTDGNVVSFRATWSEHINNN